MKRYLIFIFATGDANGGAGDFVGSANTDEEIKNVVLNNISRDMNDGNILDTQTARTTWFFNINKDNTEKIFREMKNKE